MNFKNIMNFKDSYTIVDKSFEAALQLGFLIYYNEGKMSMFSSKSFDSLDEYVEQGSYTYYVLNRSIFFGYESELKLFDAANLNFKNYIITKEKKIRPLKNGTFLGVTYEHKTKIRSLTVFNVKKEVIFQHNSYEKYISLFSSKFNQFIIQHGFGDMLCCYENTIDKKLWEFKPGGRSSEVLVLVHHQSKSNLAAVFKKTQEHTGTIWLISFDNGKIIWQQEALDRHYFYFEENNKLVGIMNNHLEMIDFDTGEKEVIDIGLNEIKVREDYTNLHEYRLFFTGKINYRYPGFGSIDLRERKIEFWQPLEEEARSYGPFLSRPYIHGNRIYLQDGRRHLRVFEEIK